MFAIAPALSLPTISGRTLAYKFASTTGSKFKRRIATQELAWTI